jgi:hypothetical protein
MITVQVLKVLFLLVHLAFNSAVLRESAGFIRVGIAAHSARRKPLLQATAKLTAYRNYDRMAKLREASGGHLPPEQVRRYVAYSFLKSPQAAVALKR